MSASILQRCFLAIIFSIVFLLLEPGSLKSQSAFFEPNTGGFHLSGQYAWNKNAKSYGGLLSYVYSPGKFSISAGYIQTDANRSYLSSNDFAIGAEILFTKQNYQGGKTNLGFSAFYLDDLILSLNADHSIWLKKLERFVISPSIGINTNSNEIEPIFTLSVSYLYLRSFHIDFGISKIIDNDTVYGVGLGILFCNTEKTKVPDH